MSSQTSNIDLQSLSKQKFTQYPVPPHISFKYEDFPSRKTILEQRDQKIFFTNRDCVACFRLKPRELNFLIASMLNSPTPCDHLFPEDFFIAKGSGNPRVLSYWQFYIIGLLKLLNSAGINFAMATTLVAKNLFTQELVRNEQTLSNFIFSLPHFFLYDTDFKEGRTQRVPKFSLTRDFDCIYFVCIDLHNYNKKFFNYVERYHKNYDEFTNSYKIPSEKRGSRPKKSES